MSMSLLYLLKVVVSFYHLIPSLGWNFPTCFQGGWCVWGFKQNLHVTSSCLTSHLSLRHPLLCLIDLLSYLCDLPWRMSYIWIWLLASLLCCLTVPLWLIFPVIWELDLEAQLDWDQGMCVCLCVYLSGLLLTRSLKR